MEENRVRLDGEAIRRIREEKRLTQLYVAKVVGVTTDTVSRWENNRYPSVRRENAIQLADALEVPVDAVLLESETVPVLPSPLHRQVRKLWVTAGCALVLALFAGIWLWPASTVRPAVEAQRLLPVYAAPRTVIPVRLHIKADQAVDGLVLREDFPAGWQLLEASPPPSSLDNVNGTVRWIVRPEGAALQISYLLQVGAQPDAGSAEFRGEVVTSQSGRNTTVPITGGALVRIAPFHWADVNADLVIDDSEALDASVASIEMKKTHLDWETVERIWDAGGYRFDGARGVFQPILRRTQE